MSTLRRLKQAAEFVSDVDRVSRKHVDGLTGAVLRHIPHRDPAVMQEHKRLLAAMAAGSPGSSLARTRYLPGVRGEGENFKRTWQNPRLGPISKALGLVHHTDDLLLGDQIIHDPHYLWTSDKVVSPWKNLGVGMHELGHAIDFNDYPVHKNRMKRLLRNTANDVYKLAPGTTLWKEHAAWNKGQKAFLSGADKLKEDPKFVRRVLEDASETKPTALGTYWGGAAGGVTGVAAALAALLAYGKQHDVPPGVAPAALGLGLGLGGAAGVLGGSYAGRKLFGAREKAKARKAYEEYARRHKQQQADEQAIAKKKHSRAAKRRQAA